jgi:diguanylate cyclase (GGDEF)-like protein
MTPETADAPRRILVVDDTEAIHEDFRKILVSPERASSLAAAKSALFGPDATRAPARVATQFVVSTAFQGREAVAMAEAARAVHEPYQVAFVDMRMPPGWDGAETIEQLWAIDRDIQVVVCTAYSDDSLELLGNRFSNSDKLLILKKPFDAVEVLQLSLTLSEKWLGERRVESKVTGLESDLQGKVIQLEHDLRHDRLTGLPNRFPLVQRLEECIKRYERDRSRRYAVMYLDCDGFKLINDGFGHELGDLLLIQIAQRLRDSLRSTDLVSQASIPSRVAGDAFLVLLEDLRDERESAVVAERLLEMLNRPYELAGTTLSMTMSIGIATCDRPDASAGEIIRDADTAMHRAKTEGGGHYTIFNVAMHAEVMARLSLVGQLREAVRDDAITLAYQPIVRLSDGQLIGFEALARWHHPERGSVSPAIFIVLAEETGLIQTLGCSVLRKACSQLAAWRLRHPEAARGLRMSVNVSRRQLSSPNLADLVVETLEETGLDAGSLVLEITEGALLTDFDSAAAALEKLRALGLGLHMDDFGTGYSSLSHLHRLPMTALKIDQTFVAAADTPSSQQILAAIVSIGRALGLTLVAEGIETEGQLAILRGLGVEDGQGYFFARPMGAEEAERFLVAGHALPPGAQDRGANR